jgi:hypothetical protein
MRKCFLFFLSSIACLSGPALAASPSQQLQSPGEPISAQTLDEVEDVYTLSDGRRLQLVQVDRKLYADLIRRDRIELFQTSDHVFASEDKTLTIEVKTDNGADKEITVTDATPERAPLRHWRLL